MKILHQRIAQLDTLFRSTQYDYDDIKKFSLSSSVFEDLQTARIINSFLFNITKIQDNIGAKLFKEILIELKEIESFATPMLDVLAKLEQLEVLDSTQNWEYIREIRNELTHDYAMDYDQRVENLKRALWAFEELEKIYTNLKNYMQEHHLNG